VGKLPSMPRKDRIYKTETLAFGGLRHFENCGEGEIYDMENMVCDGYPGISTRTERERIATVSESVSQIYMDNGATLSIDKGGLWYNGMDMGLNLERRDMRRAWFVRFGNRVVLMPFGILLNISYKILGFAEERNYPPDAEEGDCYAVPTEYATYKLMVRKGEEWKNAGWFAESMAFSSVTKAAAFFENGKLYGKDAKANTIRFESLELSALTGPGGLKEGDAVTIEGCTAVSGNNKTAIIREIGEDENGNGILRFSEYCFSMPEGEDGTAAESCREEGVLIKRTVPDMDILFEHGNRLWGAKGKELFASKLGDPRNWNSYDGLASDSWYLATQGQGEFTAGVSYGYPRFFKEGSMVTVYGSVPSGFQTTEQQTLGVKRGEERSLVQCNGQLFWNSPKGMVIYHGGTAALQDQTLGDFEIESVIGCGDERYAYFWAYIGRHPLLAHLKLQAVLRFDTVRQVWTKENCAVGCRCLTFDQGAVYCLNTLGEVEVLNGAVTESDEAREELFASYVEFGDFTEGTGNRKGVSRLRLRLSVEAESYVKVKIQYDSDGEWKPIRQVGYCGKGTVTIPIIPRRCDHYRIRLEGVGHWKMYGMERERYFGTDVF